MMWWGIKSIKYFIYMTLDCPYISLRASKVVYEA